jgi:thiamine transporter
MRKMSKKTSLFETKVYTEIAVFAALSGVLYAIRPWTNPFGGSITLGSMVPVMWVSLRRGVLAGSVAGIIYGLLALLIDVALLGSAAVIASVPQAIMEYPVAFGVIGLTGMFHKKSVFSAISGAGIAVFIRFLIHYFMGVLVWWYIYTFPEFGRYIYPLVYNGSFLLPEYIISAVILSILIKRGLLNYGL